MGIGSLIKYIPFPVVSGYLTGVGLIIIGSQIPKFLGVPGGTSWWRALISPELWQWQSAVIGTVTAGVMVCAPLVTRAVPAAILGLLAGVLAYFGLASMDESLLVIEGNKLIIGPLGGTASSMFEAITGRWQEIGELKLSQIGSLLGTAFTLAVLLSIDTLKTAVVLDALTRSRHDSNRELIAQGAGECGFRVRRWHAGVQARWVQPWSIWRAVARRGFPGSSKASWRWWRFLPWAHSSHGSR
jgi:SulP family sulfate permease